MANDKDINRDGKVDSKDDELLKKYDYNKDGLFTAEDFNALQTAYGKDQTGDEALGNVAIGGAAGTTVGGVAGLFGGPFAGLTVPVGMLGGGLIGGVAGGVKSLVDLATGNTGQAIEEKTLKEMLVTAYGITEENAGKYIDSLKVLNDINAKTDGRYNEINTNITNLTDSVEKLSYLNNLKPGEKPVTAAVAKTLGVTESTLVPAGMRATDAVLGLATGETVSNPILDMTPDEAKAYHANQIASTLATLGVTVDKATIATMDSTKLNNLLNTYKDENGLFSFPKLKLNITLTPEEQTKLNTSVGIVTQTEASVNSGIATPNTGTMNAATVDGPKTLSDENTITNPDGTITSEKVYSDGTKEITTTNADGTKTTVNIGATDWQSSGGTGGKNPTDYIYFGSSKNTFKVDENGNRVPAEAIYKYQDATSFWQSTITDEAGILATKKKLYAGGYYGASDVYTVMSANLTQSDLDAMTRAMGDANISGMDLDSFLAPKYETFLLTGRPAGEKAVDLNGDGMADESVSSALGAFISRNGLKVSDGYMAGFETAIKSGNMTLEQAMKEIREKLIAPAYPAWSDYIVDKGMDIADIASPYIENIAKSLGLPADAITMNDPLIKKALSSTGADGKPSYTSLYDLDKMIRQDGRWENTDEAQNEYANYAKTVLQQFGIM